MELMQSVIWGLIGKHEALTITQEEHEGICSHQEHCERCRQFTVDCRNMFAQFRYQERQVSREELLKAMAKN